MGRRQALSALHQELWDRSQGPPAGPIPLVGGRSRFTSLYGRISITVNATLAGQQEKLVAACPGERQTYSTSEYQERGQGNVPAKPEVLRFQGRRIFLRDVNGAGGPESRRGRRYGVPQEVPCHPLVAPAIECGLLSSETDATSPGC